MCVGVGVGGGRWYKLFLGLTYRAPERRRSIRGIDYLGDHVQALDVYSSVFEQEHSPIVVDAEFHEKQENTAFNE